jgi:superfamily II DNA or RNA helicase
MPTGAGKTTVAAEIIRLMINKGKSVMFIAHRQELVYQAQARFKMFGLMPDIIMAGHTSNGADLTIASIQTLIRRTLPEKDAVFVDEAHHAVSASFKKVLSHYSNCYIFGLTATPYRLDGKPLGDIYQDTIAAIGNQELVEQGYLVSARYFAAKETINTTDVRVTAGDYNSKDLFGIANKKVLYKNVVENYVKFCPNRERAIAFNINKEHSRKTAQEFIERGISAMHLDTDTPFARRIEILNMFRTGVYTVLCNVNILTEGFDLPSVHAIILNRATKSRCLYLQMIGRSLRPSEYKEHAICIDHANNILTHGFAEDEFTFDIHRRKEKKKGDNPIKTCPQCFAMVHASTRICENCGYEFEIKDNKELREGEFKEVVRVDFKKVKDPLPERLNKPFSIMTDNELQEVARIRKYKQGWVYHMRGLRKRYA